jgi:hypothetical protein
MEGEMAARFTGGMAVGGEEGGVGGGVMAALKQMAGDDDDKFACGSLRVGADELELQSACLGLHATLPCH